MLRGLVCVLETGNRRGRQGSCRMDLGPVSSEKIPAKTRVVEVEAVEAVDVVEQVEAEPIALEGVSSDFEADSDDSEDWEALSQDGDTIQFLRDEQLRDGLGMILLT